MSADFKFIRSSVIRLPSNRGFVLNGFDLPRQARLDRRAVVMFKVLAPAQARLTTRLNGTRTIFFVGPPGGGSHAALWHHEHSAQGQSDGV
jgi:hypothetical protein